MPLKMRVFTLNCGNGSLGNEASKQLVDQLSASKEDLFILNCQEVHFDLAMQELGKVASKKGFKVTASPQMVTHTKFGTQFHNKTGMMTLILHKPDVKVQVVNSVPARRELTRMGSGFDFAGFNKGGVLSRINVSKTIAGKESQFSIDSFNAHLDAFSDAKRAKDWANVHRLQKHKVDNWDELCAALPHLTCSGYDANTRNKLYLDGDTTVNRCAWDVPYDHDMQSLVVAPLGNVRESRPSTYHSDNPDILVKPDRHRKNRVKGGMLDIVAYTDVTAVGKNQLESADLPLVQQSQISIEPEPNSSRDHNVIGSHTITIDEREKFDRVRETIACSLAGVAPQLAAYLLSDNFIDSSEHQDYLLNVYQRYLSPEGLLQKYLQLHAHRLQYLEEFDKQATERSRQLFSEQLFYSPQPWFSGFAGEAFKTTEGLMQLADNHNSLLNLMDLQSRFLNQAVTEEECQAICSIVKMTLEKMPENLCANDQHKWIKQTNQLLSVNKLLHEYDRHLALEVIKDETKPLEKKDPLLANKRQKIADFNATLMANKEPSQVITDLQNQLDEIKGTLRLHRYNDFWSELYRKLQALITGTSLSRGGFFVVGVENEVMSENEPIAEPGSHSLKE
ncbi:hypothetical protein [Legionella micdadei]|uniref:Uncharacterized protein n=2 Tax=Legionella micdadei TaxID=451 RepID=A0A098GBR5_LEGMI|nr:hypothetical protein [Legionella micdadei]ARG96230.1 hypothetical protein B6N58_00150 [Legionella micdadei]KTD29042.1 hypothetical protein Lmic_0962 [Legionella micdadei]NSL17253.1 hypothetical protein [Legionella micdadei]CEG59405.1 protein of unknown function [Endonuclease/exonuclease/phosphatase] [Legionella micdadei]SCY00287.1 hypothetical protein SAMN02982997_00569 [Legionella micdadei]